MAGPNLATHIPIFPVQTISGNTFKTGSIIEKLSQTFNIGVPVEIDAGTGGVIEWDGATITKVILGISGVFGSNLSSTGAGAPGAFGSVGFPGTNSTFGKVPFQSNAVNIAMGAPMTDGRTLFFEANQDTIFEAQVDNSAGNVAADWTPVNTDVGKEFGLTKDAAGGQWYVDRGKTTSGTNTVVVVVGLEPNDGAIPNGRVRFKFLVAATEFAH